MASWAHAAVGVGSTPQVNSGAIPVGVGVGCPTWAKTSVIQEFGSAGSDAYSSSDGVRLGPVCDSAGLRGTHGFGATIARFPFPWVSSGSSMSLYSSSEDEVWDEMLEATNLDWRVFGAGEGEVMDVALGRCAGVGVRRGSNLFSLRSSI